MTGPGGLVATSLPPDPTPMIETMGGMINTCLGTSGATPFPQHLCTQAPSPDITYTTTDNNNISTCNILPIHPTTSIRLSIFLQTILT